MLRNHIAASPSAQPDHPPKPPQHRRGSSHHAFEKDDGYYHSPRHPDHSSTTSSIALPPSATPPRRENAFNAPRPSLLPYQEYHSGFSDDDPASSPLYSPSTTHRRQQSFSNLLPLALRNRTPSPTRKTPSVAEEMPYTGDGRSRPGTATESSPRGGFAGWLSGTAAGSALGIASPDDRPPTLSRQTTPDVTPTRLLRKSQTVVLDNNASTPRPSVSTTASRFMSAISTRLAPPTTPSTPTTIEGDELYNLSIETAIFPPGSPSDRDAFSPAAFKNLQTNAAGLLARFQAAYRHKALLLRDLEADRAAQRDELEEAVTRAAHLRQQLESLAARAAEQERDVKALVEELMAEKNARQEERLARRREDAPAAVVEEDLGVDHEEGVRKTWRSSGTGKSETSMSFDPSDEESSVDEESVFSRSRSPTTVGASTVDGSVVDGPTTKGAPPLEAAGRGARNSAQMSTFQKIFKGIAGDGEESSGGCRNCKGKDASVAWDTVSLLRDENKHLKQRVGQLEVAVEGALDLVNGLGL